MLSTRCYQVQDASRQQRSFGAKIQVLLCPEHHQKLCVLRRCLLTLLLRSVVDCARQIFAADGVAGFYRGSPSFLQSWYRAALCWHVLPPVLCSLHRVSSCACTKLSSKRSCIFRIWIHKGCTLGLFKVSMKVAETSQNEKMNTLQKIVKNKNKRKKRKNKLQ